MHDSDDNAVTLFLPDEAATQGLGAALAPALAPGMVVFLEGDLGAGKTTLVRGLLRALGFEGKVKSPTYTFVELYAISRLDLYHFDFYRINQQEEYLDAGFDEYFKGKAVCLVEWPDKVSAYLPSADLRICISIVAGSNDEADARQAELLAESAEGLRCLKTCHFSTATRPAAMSSSTPPPR